MSLIYTGPVHPAQKLSDDQVRRMRELRADGSSYAELVRNFDVSLSTVQEICCGTARVHAPGPITRGHDVREPDPWFTAALEGLSWESAKLLVRMCAA